MKVMLIDRYMGMEFLSVYINLGEMSKVLFSDKPMILFFFETDTMEANLIDMDGNPVVLKLNEVGDNWGVEQTMLFPVNDKNIKAMQGILKLGDGMHVGAQEVLKDFCTKVEFFNTKKWVDYAAEMAAANN